MRCVFFIVTLLIASTRVPQRGRRLVIALQKRVLQGGGARDDETFQ
jgi:hypothetical protein